MNTSFYLVYCLVYFMSNIFNMYGLENLNVSKKINLLKNDFITAHLNEDLLKFRMKKPTLIFDFDSTLIRDESLELILVEKLKDSPEKIDEIARITSLGMEGGLSFLESLEKRLEIASPSKNELEIFGKNAIKYISDGMEEVLNWAKNHFDIWILSGGLYESIKPFADHFDIKHVHAVKLKWNQDGSFNSIDKDDPFSESKLNGAKKLSTQWESPSIIVGDGFTDYQLFEKKFTNHFIAFTKNIRRSFLNTSDSVEANNSEELRRILQVICT